RRTGRRPGNSGTQAAILASARELFADRGFAKTSVRAIAGAAGVDPALVHHYFGTKEKLFLAVVRPPADPAQLIPRTVPGDVATLGQRVARMLLGVLDDEEYGQRFQALLRSALAEERSARLLREFFTHRVLAYLQLELDGVVPAEKVPLRAGLVASQVFGLVSVRHFIAMPALRQVSREDLIMILAPTLQHYLAGELPHGAPDAERERDAF